MSHLVAKYRHWIMGLALLSVFMIAVAGCSKSDDSSSSSSSSSSSTGDSSSSGDKPGPSSVSGNTGMMGGMVGGTGATIPGMGMTASTTTTAAPSSNPAEPTVPFSAVASGVKVVSIRNADKSVSRMLKFKHKTPERVVINVQMPAEMKDQKLSKDGWNTLFTVFSTDYEAKIANIERNNPTVASSSTSGGSTMGSIPGMGGGIPGMAGGSMGGGIPGMIGGGSTGSLPGMVGVGTIPGM